ncbi:hypothetical protein NDU88_003273 [Pleurodeles waltl]|uniref:Uncharacterized protein n=1 Tax=Pleurodeles waltl TaxID=8319 RepID=A0AAV7MRS5_PLEWA|nr:hypothetical protein NDU88_003273 [Pleurodeles waltl]
MGREHLRPGQGGGDSSALGHGPAVAPRTGAFFTACACSRGGPCGSRASKCNSAKNPQNKELDTEWTQSRGTEWASSSLRACAAPAACAIMSSPQS